MFSEGENKNLTQKWFSLSSASSVFPGHELLINLANKNSGSSSTASVHTVYAEERYTGKKHNTGLVAKILKIEDSFLMNKIVNDIEQHPIDFDSDDYLYWLNLYKKANLEWEDDQTHSLQAGVALNKYIEIGISTLGEESLLEVMPRIYHYGIVDINGQKQPYILMEYKEGTLLEKILTKKNPSLMEKGNKSMFCESVLNTLESLEDIGVFLDLLAILEVSHADIKPANLKTGKVLDFGLSNYFGKSGEDNQSTDRVSGTISHMAPEVILGKTGPRSDQYSFAVIISQLLAGEICLPSMLGGNLRPIFEIMEMRLSGNDLLDGEFVDNLFMNFDITMEQCESIRNVINKALSRDPNKRYVSCSELLSKVRSTLSEALESQLTYHMLVRENDDPYRTMTMPVLRNV